MSQDALHPETLSIRYQAGLDFAEVVAQHRARVFWVLAAVYAAAVAFNFLGAFHGRGVAFLVIAALQLVSLRQYTQNPNSTWATATFLLTLFLATTLGIFVNGGIDDMRVVSLLIFAPLTAVVALGLRFAPLALALAGGLTLVAALLPYLPAAVALQVPEPDQVHEYTMTAILAAASVAMMVFYKQGDQALQTYLGAAIDDATEARKLEASLTRDIASSLLEPITALRKDLRSQIDVDDASSLNPLMLTALARTSQIERPASRAFLSKLFREEADTSGNRCVRLEEWLDERQPVWAFFAESHGINFRMFRHSATPEEVLVNDLVFESAIDTVVYACLEHSAQEHFRIAFTYVRETIEVEVIASGCTISDDFLRRAALGATTDDASAQQSLDAFITGNALEDQLLWVQHLVRNLSGHINFQRGRGDDAYQQDGLEVSIKLPVGLSTAL